MRELTVDERALLNALGDVIEEGNENAGSGEFAFAYWSPELDSRLKNTDWYQRERLLKGLKKLGLVASEGRGKHASWWITSAGVGARKLPAGQENQTGQTGKTGQTEGLSWKEHPFKFGEKPSDGITCDVHDRVEMVKESTDTAWLERVLKVPGLQKTVMEAAQRRLRKVLKEQYAGNANLR